MQRAGGKVRALALHFALARQQEDLEGCFTSNFVKNGFTRITK